MKNNYKTMFRKAIVLLAVITGFSTYAQDINFTFANATITNDGSNDFYEVDILIQTINSTGSFKLSSGQLYFTYNTAAFGENVKANNKIEFTYPDNQGYICAQGVDATQSAKIYGVFTVNDNTTSRVSWACSQAFAASTFADDNITETPTKLFHMKIEFTDSNQLPMVLFEDGEVYDDQFYTACGPFTGGTGFDSADCGTYPGTEIFNDFFDSNGATLSNEDFELAKISVYPNPTSDIIHIDTKLVLTKVELFDIVGKHIITLKENMKQLNVDHLKAGVYLLTIHSNNGKLTRKIVVE